MAAAAPRTDRLTRAGWLALAVAVPGLVAAATLDPGATASAASQDWPPFVLVAGLLALGLVARRDGLFDAAGAAMADVAPGAFTLFLGAAALVAVVTAVLNLDTAVAFTTPVVVAAARRRGTAEAPFLYLAVFMANGASLLLPGSNLTNLIVLGQLHPSGASFAARMAVPWLASVVAVAAVVGVLWRRSLRASTPRLHEPARVRVGLGLLGVGAVVAAMLTLTPRGEALVALGVGGVALLWDLLRRRVSVDEARRTVNLPILAGLLATALDLGVLGRAWSGPASLLAHAGAVASAVVGAVASVVVNNLPAASLLAARHPAHAHALLVGLDLGPNLAVTGALSALLWLQVGRAVGSSPSARRYTEAGLVVVPVSMTLALVALAYAH